MTRKKTRPLRIGLALSMVMLSFFSLGCKATAVQPNDPEYLPLYLANGAFDPLSEPEPIALPKELRLGGYPEGGIGYYVVQFKGPVSQAWKEGVVSAGGRIFDYIPKFAFIVKIDDRGREVVQAMGAVRWIGIYQPGYRLASDLWASIHEKGDRPVDLIVSIFPGEDVPALAAEMSRLGGEIEEISESNERIRVTIPGQRIAGLSRLTGVKWIEKAPEFRIFPSMRKGPKE
jgi:hypothetical protein